MDLSYLFGKDPRIQGRVLTGGTTIVNVADLVQNFDLTSIFGTNGTTIDYSSSSANDTAAGTGAQKVTTYGLGVDWLPLSEEVSLSGTTVVTGAKTFMRIFAITVSATGSGGKAAGDIYAIQTGSSATYTTAGIPDTLTSGIAKIVGSIGVQTGWTGYYTIPANRIGEVKKVIVGNAAQTARLLLLARDNSATDDNEATELDVELNAQSGPEDLNTNHELLQYGEKTDLVWKVIAGTAGAITSVQMSVHMIQMNKALGG